MCWKLGFPSRLPSIAAACASMSSRKTGITTYGPMQALRPHEELAFPTDLALRHLPWKRRHWHQWSSARGAAALDAKAQASTCPCACECTAAMATDSSSTSGFQPAPGEGRRDGGGDGAGVGEAGLSGAGSVQDGGDERALREQRTPDWQAPIGFELTGEYFWQAVGDDGCWRDVDPSWNEPIFRGLAGGAERLYLTYVWCNSCHKKLWRITPSRSRTTRGSIRSTVTRAWCALCERCSG